MAGVNRPPPKSRRTIRYAAVYVIVIGVVALAVNLLSSHGVQPLDVIGPILLIGSNAAAYVYAGD